MSFPKILDVYSLCSDDLKKLLDKGKELEMEKKEDAKKIHDNKFELYKTKLEEQGKIIPEDTRKIYKEFKKQ